MDVNRELILIYYMSDNLSFMGVVYIVGLFSCLLINFRRSFFMTREELYSIQEILGGYKFKNLDLLRQAFVRKSYSKENGGENNEVLEFIGDKVLDFVIVKKFVMNPIKPRDGMI